MTIGRKPSPIMDRCAVEACSSKARRGMSYCASCERVAGNAARRSNPLGPPLTMKQIRFFCGGQNEPRQGDVLRLDCILGSG